MNYFIIKKMEYNFKQISKLFDTKIGNGFQNLGNTCFMNSILQVFCNVPTITYYLMSQEFKKETNQENYGKAYEFYFFAELLKLLKLYYESSKANLKPIMVLKQLQVFYKIYFRMEQEDSTELYLNILDLIEKSLPFKNKEDNSFKQTVYANLTHTSVCSKCDAQFKYDTEESVLFVDCNHQELKDSILDYFKKETATAFCETCKKDTEKTISKKIKRLPKLLTIAFKRFDNTMKKNANLVLFGDTLKINRQKFKLKAIVYHIGRSTSGGHYHCVVRKSDTTFIDYNDQHISKVTNNLNLINPNAYMLFFEAVE